MVVCPAEKPDPGRRSPGPAHSTGHMSRSLCTGGTPHGHQCIVPSLASGPGPPPATACMQSTLPARAADGCYIASCDLPELPGAVTLCATPRTRLPVMATSAASASLQLCFRPSTTSPSPVNSAQRMLYTATPAASSSSGSKHWVRQLPARMGGRSMDCLRAGGSPSAR